MALHVGAALRQAAPRLRSARMHSHTVHFTGSKKTYPYSAVDFFDSTCPICEAIRKGREPVCDFVQPIPGVAEKYQSLPDRFRRWATWVLAELFGQWPLRVRVGK
jgi:hypothetical protein